MDRNRKNRGGSYYASSRRDLHSLGNGRSYRGPYDSNKYENDSDSYRDVNYDDGYDDNYPSPAYSMGSGNFNMGRKVNRDTGNMFKPDYNDPEDESFRDKELHDDYDLNYSNEIEIDEEELYGQPIGRYNRNYFDTRNRENKVVRHRKRTDESNKTGKKGLSYSERQEENDGTDWYGYYNRAYYGANSSNYDNWPKKDTAKRKDAGTQRRKRPYF